MLSFNYWILSCLFLGHLIDGVNREIIVTQLENLNVNEKLSKEARKILNLHFKQTDSQYEDSSQIQSRRTRSLSESLNLICPPYDSCINRCNETPRVLPYTCNCDASCVTFSDCCVDYKEECLSDNNVTEDTNESLSIFGLECEILFKKYNLLIVSKCQHDYKDVVVTKLCSLKIPKYCSFPNNLNASDAELVLQKCKQSFYQSCLSKLKIKCDTNIEPLCTIMAKKCEKLASKNCYRCNTAFWPVLGQNGIVYRNSYCALCNEQKTQILLSPRDLESITKEKNENNSLIESSASFVRHCIPVDVDSCPDTEMDEMKVSCRNHTGTVIAGKGSKRVIYKNVHCAVCNGAKVETLQCATMASLMRGLIRPLLETFITGDEQGIQFDDIPATFSILLNFGLDGRKRMYFSSEGEEEMKRNQERCGQGRIWDPFSEICRQLYCSTEFVLVDYRCVRKEIPSDKESISRNGSTAVIPDARAEFVHLTLSAEMEVLDILQFHGQDIETICNTIRKSLAKSFNIHIERIKNVQFNISIGYVGNLEEIRRFIEEMDDLHPITFKIEFDLYEDFEINTTEPEPTVDRIVSMLASSLSINGFEIDINNATSRIFEIHQSVSPLESWCTPEYGGKKKEYWNSEFSLILDDDNSTMRENRIKGIFVNRTGKFYPRGKFVADILFQGYQFSNSLINVSGVAIVCDAIKLLNESCTRILINSDEFTLFENDTVSIHNESLKNLVDDSDYERAENNSLWVCLKPLSKSSKKFFNIDMDFSQAIVSYVLLWVSVLAMAIVLMTYISFESLRNLPGCNTMNLTFSLMAMQITFLFGERSTVKGTACIVVGHLFHYEILCSFMWMNVMAFDLFRTFGNKNILSNIRSKRKYLPKYMIYSYLSPVSIILIASLIDYFLNDSLFAPNYGKNDLCWISNPNASILFFAAPLAIIMCVNFVLFLMTIFSIRSVKHLSNAKGLQTNRNGKSDLVLYARMAFLIGLTWVLAFAAAYVRKEKLIGQILTYLYIIFNTLQGVFLFWIFVCNKRVYGLYKEAFRNLLKKISKHAKHESSSAAIARFSDALKRSVSTNTVVSTLSNVSSSSTESQLSTIKE